MSQTILRLLLGSLFCCLGISHPAGQPAPSSCDESLQFYEDHHYQIRAVTFEAIFSQKITGEAFFALKKFWQAQFATLQTQVPIQKDEPFTVANYIQTQNTLRQLLGQLRPGERFKLAYVAPRLEACQTTSAQPSLDIVIQIFTTESISSLHFWKNPLRN